jgi:hypothetical protein
LREAGRGVFYFFHSTQYLGRTYADSHHSDEEDRLIGRHEVEGISENTTRSHIRDTFEQGPFRKGTAVVRLRALEAEVHEYSKSNLIFTLGQATQLPCLSQATDVLALIHRDYEHKMPKSPSYP